MKQQREDRLIGGDQKNRVNTRLMSIIIRNHHSKSMQQCNQKQATSRWWRMTDEVLHSKRQITKGKSAFSVNFAVKIHCILSHLHSSSPPPPPPHEGRESGWRRDDYGTLRPPISLSRLPGDSEMMSFCSYQHTPVFSNSSSLSPGSPAHCWCCSSL